MKIQILKAENEGLEAEKESLVAEKKALGNRLNEVSLKLKLKDRHYDALVAGKECSLIETPVTVMQVNTARPAEIKNEPGPIGLVNVPLSVPSEVNPKKNQKRPSPDTPSVDADRPKRTRSTTVKFDSTHIDINRKIKRIDTWDISK